MKDNAVIADFRRFTDDDTHSMVNNEPAPEFGSRVDFDSRQKARDFRNEARKKVQALTVEKMRDAISENRLRSWVKQSYFKN